MEIVYLKNYARYKQTGVGNQMTAFGPPRGLSEAEIIQMEREMNNRKPFPKAYREFLFLGGEFSTLQLEDYGKKTPLGTEKFRQGAEETKNQYNPAFCYI